MANKKTDLLSEKTGSIEEVLESLKPSLTNKKNYVLSASSLDTIREYIADVKDTTRNIKSVNDLDAIINHYEDDLYKYDNEVRSLKYELGEKDDKIQILSRNLDISKNTISKQEDKITFLQTQLSRFKDLWEKVKKIFRIRVDYDKNEHFIKVADEFYEKGILNKDGTDVIKTDMQNNKFKKYDR